MFRMLVILILLFPAFAQAQRLEWRADAIERTQTLSFDMAFGEEVTLITKINASDFELRVLATHAIELVDGTVMAAILRTQPSVQFVNSGGAFVEWQSDARQFQSLGLIEEDDFVLKITMPAVEGADFVPNVKAEFILRPITPESQSVFLDTAQLAEGVKGANDYGLADLQAATIYPEVDMGSILTVRDRPQLSIEKVGGLCREGTLIRSVYARMEDLSAEILTPLSNFPQECWANLATGLTAADVSQDSDYQPDLRIRLREDGGEVYGFVFAAGTNAAQQIFIQNTSRGWLYGNGDGNWERISNGSRTDVPFGNGVLAIRNPRGGETADATENDAFVSYLLN